MSGSARRGMADSWETKTSSGGLNRLYEIDNRPDETVLVVHGRLAGGGEKELDRVGIDARPGLLDERRSAGHIGRGPGGAAEIHGDAVGCRRLEKLGWSDEIEVGTRVRVAGDGAFPAKAVVAQVIALGIEAETKGEPSGIGVPGRTDRDGPRDAGRHVQGAVGSRCSRPRRRP